MLHTKDCRSYAGRLVAAVAAATTIPILLTGDAAEVDAGRDARELSVVTARSPGLVRPPGSSTHGRLGEQVPCAQRVRAPSKTRQFLNAGLPVRLISALPLPPRLNAHNWLRATASNTPRPTSFASNSARHSTPLGIGGGPSTIVK
jgi:hypothetical protein